MSSNYAISVMLCLMMALALSGCISPSGDNRAKSVSIISESEEDTPAKANLYLVRNPPGIAISLLDQHFKDVASDCNISLSVLRGRFDEESYSPGMSGTFRITKGDFEEKVIGSGGESNKALIAMIPLSFTPELGDTLKVTAIVKLTYPEQSYDIPVQQVFNWG
jgi:hypothetical protein